MAVTGTEIEVYASLADLPVEIPKLDGDDTEIHRAVEQANEHFANDRSGARHLEAPVFYVHRRVIPLYRVLKKGDKGLDVAGMQRALHASGYRARSSTHVYGEGTVAEVMSFQDGNDLKADGEYGPLTHAKLSPCFDAYGAWMMAQAAGKDKRDESLKLLVAAALLTFHHRDEIGYTQDWRRMVGVNESIMPPKFPPVMDCSSGATWLFFAAGLPDPNGRGYKLPAEGYTGTLCQHGKRAKHRKDNRGLLYFYGAGEPYMHVTVGIGEGLCWSMGSTPGPYIVEHDYRSDFNHCREYV